MGYREERSDWPETPRDVMADEIDMLRSSEDTLGQVLDACKAAGFDGSTTLVEFIKTRLQPK